MDTDAENFKTTFLPMGRLMYAEAIRILGDAREAEDAVQDVYARLWERRDGLAAIANIRAYVLAMTRNRCITLALSLIHI